MLGLSQTEITQSYAAIRLAVQAAGRYARYHNRDMVASTMDYALLNWRLLVRYGMVRETV